jgi:Tol biopolymer transport system component
VDRCRPTAATAQRLTPPEPDVNGIKIHNFDPAWGPTATWIVFASTRGDPAVGPDPVRSKLFLPQSDLWRMRADGTGPEQLTFLTGSELSPQMMREGRITMTTEKVSGDALSARRSPPQLGPHRLPPAARPARDVARLLILPT